MNIIESVKKFLIIINICIFCYCVLSHAMNIIKVKRYIYEHNIFYLKFD